MNFEALREIADAVLFEGYVLYPYRASSTKNQVRWQFGVLGPRGGDEPWFSQTECLAETGEQTAFDVRLRFMRISRRTDADGAGEQAAPSWDEGVVEEIDASIELSGERAAAEVPLRIAGGTERDDGVERRSWPLTGALRIEALRLPGPYGLAKLSVRAENHSPRPPQPSTREDELRVSMVATHSLLGVRGGAFVSLMDPPEWARQAAEQCRNERTWPVLAGAEGERTAMLSSPIILYDHPRVAPESPTNLCDGTEIDEILTLRTMALTEEEKAEARATDERAARIIDRVDDMPAEILERLHGTVRYLRTVTTPATSSGTARGPEGGAALAERAASVPWWDPGADASVSPETDSVAVPGGSVAKGSRVWLYPGRTRADAQDMFLRGRAATVRGVFFDVDDTTYVAVTLDDDPAADLHTWHGRYLYFSPDEIELRREKP